MSKNEEIINSLKKIGEYAKERKSRFNKLYESGYFYNIFEILNIELDEVNTHSSILCNLLDPKGSHGQDRYYLDLFLKHLNKYDSLANSDVIVDKNYYIGKIDDESGGYIDILLNFGNKFKIAIENKINAKDQPNQLYRYETWLKNNSEKHLLLYLTKNGDDPSYSSTNICEREKPYWKNISYTKDITEWLKTALEKTNQKQILNQYLRTISKFSGEDDFMNEEFNKEVIETLNKDLDTADFIIDNYKKLSETFVNEFLNELTSKLNKGAANQYEIISHMDGYNPLEKYYHFEIKKQEWESIAIKFQFMKPDLKELHYGIGPLEENGKPKQVDNHIKTTIRKNAKYNKKGSDWWLVEKTFTEIREIKLSTFKDKNFINRIINETMKMKDWVPQKYYKQTGTFRKGVVANNRKDFLRSFLETKITHKCCKMEKSVLRLRSRTNLTFQQRVTAMQRLGLIMKSYKEFIYV